MKISELLQFNSVSKVLSELKLLTRSKNTEKTYLKGLIKFAKFMNISNLDELIDEIKNKNKNANEIYRNFILSLANNNLAPKTVNAWSSAIKKFFAANGIEIKKLPLKIYNVHEDYLPSKEDLKKVLEFCGIRTKAIILALLSSGLRVDELRNLKISEIDLDKEPAIVKVKGMTAKERKSRITFFSKEAKNVLKNYFEKRKNLGHELNENSFVIATDKGNQMSYQNLHFILNKAFKIIARKEGKRFNIHAHSLRKFFKTQLIAAGVPGPIVDRLMGHARYLAREYELYTEEQLKEWYKKGENNLLILE